MSPLLKCSGKLIPYGIAHDCLPKRAIGLIVLVDSTRMEMLKLYHQVEKLRKCV